MALGLGHLQRMLEKAEQDLIPGCPMSLVTSQPLRAHLLSYFRGNLQRLLLTHCKGFETSL